MTIKQPTKQQLAVATELIKSQIKFERNKSLTARVKNLSQQIRSIIGESYGGPAKKLSETEKQKCRALQNTINVLRGWDGKCPAGFTWSTFSDLRNEMEINQSHLIK